MNIYFIRHGNPNYAQDCLTEKGVEQAEKLAEFIKDWEIDEIYQSPMGRAKQTASYSLKKWEKSAETLEMIREISWGDKSGNAYASDSPWSIIDGLIEKEHKYPAGDEWKNLKELKNDRLVEDFGERCCLFDKFLEEHGYSRSGQLYKVENPNEKNIVFFCHGGISAALIAYALNIPFFQFNAHVGIKLTSISKISFDGKPGEFVPAKLEYLNATPHLGFC